MRGLNPAPLHQQLGLAVFLACEKPSQNIAYMQGLGHVADIIRVWGWAWVMLQRGLVCIIKTSFQKASQPIKHCFLEGIGGICEAHFRAFWRQALPGIPAMLGPRSTNVVNTVKNCAERWAVVLSVLLLLWLARVLRGPCLFPVGFRARARDPSHKTLLVTVLCCTLFGALARARATPCQPSGLGPGHLGLGATLIT